MSPTRCKLVRLPCHDQPTYLVQRGHDSGALTWSGVECRTCGATYTFENDEDRSGWEPCDDVWPGLDEATCWALP